MDILIILSGLLSGILSGMGIGGGAILIPALVLLVNPPQQVAQSTNLIFFIPTAIIAIVVHIRNRMIDFRASLPVITFGIAGAYVGSRLALSLDSQSMRRYFGIFLLLMGAYELIKNFQKPRNGDIISEGKKKIDTNKRGHGRI